MYDVRWSCLFFFSSRRRHTRYIGDWSSDVCSSDLQTMTQSSPAAGGRPFSGWQPGTSSLWQAFVRGVGRVEVLERYGRSEERRVGKECRCRLWVDQEKGRERVR